MYSLSKSIPDDLVPKMVPIIASEVTKCCQILPWNFIACAGALIENGTRMPTTIILNRREIYWKVIHESFAELLLFYAFKINFVSMLLNKYKYRRSCQLA